MSARFCPACHHWRPCDCDLSDAARAPDEAALVAADRREDREGRACPPGWTPATGIRAAPCEVCGEQVWRGQGWTRDRGIQPGWSGLHRRCPDEIQAGAWTPATNAKEKP